MKNNRLKRLEFMITNDCNLNCRYCYANSGTYGQTPNYISREVIDRTVELLQEFEINVIEELVLFGGEPTMNLEAIEYLCRIMEKEFNNPLIKMVSNLTLLDEKLIYILKNYPINLTVSLDGPRFLNDEQRLFKNSTRSVFEVVSENLNLLNKENIRINSIETTYTNHISKYMSRKEVASYIFDNFDNIDTVQVCDEYETFSDLAYPQHIFFRDLDIDESEIEKLSYINLNDESGDNYTNNICSAGRNMISIFSDGGIYPCHLFSKSINHIANVFDDTELIQEKYNNFIEKYDLYINNIKGFCANCSNLKVCNICPAALIDDIDQNNSIDYKLKEYCENIKIRLDRIEI